MKSVEISYLFDGDGAALRERPADASAALRRMNDGSQAFAEMFVTTGEQTEPARRVIRVDPRDVGIQGDGTESPEQRPFAAVLGCSDARVPIGLIFNEGPNDLFVVRVAGNTLGDDVRGSLNYALEHLGESLKLLVVLGHSGCGAVTAAVDVFLAPSGYLSLMSKHAVRMVVDRLLVVVHASARRLHEVFGAGITHHPRYREALIEVSVITNAALAAHALREQVGGEGVQAVYGAYDIANRTVWAPRHDSGEVIGLAAPPPDSDAFSEFSRAVLQSERIKRMLHPTAAEYDTKNSRKA